MDVIGLQKAIDKLNDETLPQLERIVTRLKSEVVDELHGILDRIDGTRIEARINVPPKGSIGG